MAVRSVWRADSLKSAVAAALAAWATISSKPASYVSLHSLCWPRSKPALFPQYVQSPTSWSSP